MNRIFDIHYESENGMQDFFFNLPTYVGIRKYLIFYVVLTQTLRNSKMEKTTTTYVPTYQSK